MSVKHIIISGRVQGVGFRRFVFQEAKKLGLKGWVRNLWDGRVEILVHLESAKESAFMGILKKGPALSQVAALETHDYPQEIKQTDFEIKEDGSQPYAE